MARRRTTHSRSPRIVRIVDSRSMAIDLMESGNDLVEFDFCAAMRVLCEDIADRVPALAHVRMDDVAVCVTRARRGGRSGLWAKLTPMRFEGGASEGLRRGRRYRIEPLILGGRERLYILTFCLPRFLDLTYREKLVTVFHELFHVGPCFDGDHRRFAGRYHVHSARASKFDDVAERLCDEYLSTSPAPEACKFLRHRTDTLLAHHGAITGLAIPIPKLVAIEDAA